jgi:hypothetical protein
MFRMNIQDLVGKYVELRDKKDALRKAYNEKTAKVDSVLEKMEAVMMSALNAAGVDSAKTPSGTVFMSERSSATVADRDLFFDFVREHEAWDMLESRVNKTSVTQYLETTQALPPGINYRTEKTINVRRPTARH